MQVAAGLLTPLPIALIDRDEMTIAGPLDPATILRDERTIVGYVDAATMLGANQSSVVARSTDDDLPTGFTPDVPQHRSASSDVAGPTGPLAVGQAFGSRYHIIRVLGIGGMGAEILPLTRSTTIEPTVRSSIVIDPSLRSLSEIPL